MSHQIIHLQPVAQAERIYSLDIVRGIAVLGILLLNVVGYGLAFSYHDPSLSGGAEGWNLAAWFINEMLFEGSMRGLFTLLFGTGFMLLTSRWIDKGFGIKVADLYFRRLFWLLIFGIIHAYLLVWYGEILFPYAICGMLLFVFRKMKPQYLIFSALVLLSIGTYKEVLKHQENLKIQEEGLVAYKLKEKKIALNSKQKTELNKWKKKKRKISVKRVQQENSAMRKGYWPTVKHRVKLAKRYQTKHIYDFYIWDILSLMLLGVALFKWKVFNGGYTYKLYLLLMFAGYLVGLIINYYETSLVLDSNFDFLAKSKAMQTYHLGRLFMTVGHIGAIMLFVKSGILRFLQKALAAVGRMALTNYLVQTIICNTFFLGAGFGMFGKLQRYELYDLVAAIWVIQLIYSPIWLKYFRFGPFEWIWRSLTYLKIQPFRKIAKP